MTDERVLAIARGILAGDILADRRELRQLRSLTAAQTEAIRSLKATMTLLKEVADEIRDREDRHLLLIDALTQTLKETRTRSDSR